VRDAGLLKIAPAERLAAVLGFGVSNSLVNQLMDSSRFQSRLIGLIMSRLGDAPDLDPVQARALAMQQDELIDLSKRAGCVWHAGSIARTIEGASQRLLVAQLGEKNYNFALRYIGMQPPNVTSYLVSEDIPNAVLTDGTACLAAWCEVQPNAIAARLRLVRPVASPKAIHESWGPRIVSCLLVD
jgi:hypothetical protein